MKMGYEAFTGKKPNVQNMNVFDTICYAYIQEKKKLDPRSEKGLLLGCDKYSPAYYIYFEERGCVKKVRCIVFTNNFYQCLKMSSKIMDAMIIITELFYPMMKQITHL